MEIIHLEEEFPNEYLDHALKQIRKTMIEADHYVRKYTIGKIKSSPPMFMLMAAIVLKISTREPCYETPKNQTYFCFSDLKLIKKKPLMTQSQYRRALENLVKIGFIEVENCVERGYKLITVLFNPFGY